MAYYKRYLFLLSFIFLPLSIMADTYIYRGRYTNPSEIIYTWDGKNLYKGRYPNSSEIINVYDGKYFYKGRYSNSSNIIYTTDGKVPIAVLLMVL